eukprot:TRINITY_DN75557_c0_g1_i1.p1 TRINITY_DN75557_c0_g1~~TRINITY_DN75557_c0_g1_i1.p1  ORF type:complete len:277 (-),score=51.62 TRINITY_DN75557_c0_g1_i1:292-1050(-)
MVVSAPPASRVAMQQLALIQARFRGPPVQRLLGDRRAVVACILRQPREPHVIDSLDVLFILRAADNRTGGSRGNRWSGQVGFPGGHAEEEESDHEAVSRECFEEIGLSLNSDAYRFLGCVPERRVARKKDVLIVACRVYEQLMDEQPQHLQTREVAACGWVPVSTLLADDCAKPLQWSSTSNGGSSLWDGLPSVNLRVRDVRLATGVSSEEAHTKFVLWGLTLGIVNDWLQMTGLRLAPIGLQPKIAAASHL